MTPSEIEKIFRDEAGRALATLIRLVGDFDLAEDALQDAFAVALERWPAADPPSNPRAWLVNVGRNKAIDRVRRQVDVSRQAVGTDARIAEQCGGFRRGRRGDRARRRHAAADLHLLPSGLRRRGPGRADAAHGLRADDRAGRARLSGQRGRHGAAAGARQAENPARRHSLRGAGSRSAGAAAARRARGDLSRLHRRLCRHLGRGSDAAGSGARSDPAWPPARRADAATGRDQGLAGADAAARRAPRRRARPQAATSCCWKSRIARCGIMRRSPKA